MSKDDTQKPQSASDKGKGKASSGSSSQPSQEASAKPSLLRSALGNPSDISSTLSGLVSSSGKGQGYGQVGSSGASADQIGAALQGGASSSSGAASSATPLGPRQGFRTSIASHAQNAAAQRPDFSADFNSFEALDRGLHDIVRQHASTSSAAPGEAPAQLDPAALMQNPELLDPAYHEAWARSIPAPTFSRAEGGDASSAGPVFDSEQQHSDLVAAWQRALSGWDGTDERAQPHSDLPAGSTSHWWPASSSAYANPDRPRTAEEGGFMDLLAAEDADEAARMGFAGESEVPDFVAALRADELERAEAFEPPPEPGHALQSTDPRTALSFLLDDNDAEKSKRSMQRELEGIRSRLTQTLEKTQAASGTSFPPTDAEVNEDNRQVRRARRVQARRELRKVEYELGLLEHKAGYADEVYAPDAGRAYPAPPDLADTDEDDQRDEKEQERELEERRKRAIERLESLRKHLDAKL